jgi:putative DNA-invertase from lambdoid prophage Rac
MRVGLYVRISTVDQNPEMQLQELESYSKSRGFTVVRVFEDRATGTNTNRPAFRELLSLARARELDAIVVWKLDRFARSLKDLIVTLQDLDDIGVRFISLKDHIDFTTAHGRLLVHILACFAEFESATCKERVLAGIANARRNGKRLGRPTRIDEYRVTDLRRRGYSLSTIGKQVGCTRGAVSKILRRTGFPNPVLKPNNAGNVFC